MLLIYIIFFSSEQCRPDEQLWCSTTAHATVATSFDKRRATPTSRLRCTFSRQRSLQRSDVAPIQLCGAAVKAAPAASAGVATIQQQQQQLHKQTHIYNTYTSWNWTSNCCVFETKKKKKPKRKQKKNYMENGKIVAEFKRENQVLKR